MFSGVHSTPLLEISLSVKKTTELCFPPPLPLHIPLKLKWKLSCETKTVKMHYHRFLWIGTNFPLWFQNFNLIFGILEFRYCHQFCAKIQMFDFLAFLYTNKLCDMNFRAKNENSWKPAKIHIILVICVQEH